MTRTSCISPPPKNPSIKLYEWQVKFCQENQCTAKLLAFFIAWHDWKLEHDRYIKMKQLNDARSVKKVCLGADEILAKCLAK